MGAFVFLCNASTEKECLDRHLFGTNAGRVWEEHLRRIEVGDYLFLWNFETGVLRGPFIALTQCTKDIEPDAWKDTQGHSRGFPFQVRVDGIDQYEQYEHPLSADDLDLARLLHPTDAYGLMPPASLDNVQLERILKMLHQKNKDTAPLLQRPEGPMIPGRDDSLATAFIFKCDHATAGQCLADNVMGAPTKQFRPVVSRVQRGATVFLWHINEHKLYGVWRAIDDGQYNPAVFPGPHFNAVVYCERQINLQSGLDEPSVRKELGYDGAYPPYIVRPSQARHLLDLLQGIYGLGQVERFGADDGHVVKSLGEVFIDNWLYWNGFVHAYEKSVQIGERYRRCDFYLPSTPERREVYIEYWGMLGQKDYDHRRQEKLDEYKGAHIEPLELFPKDIRVLPDVLPRKLARYKK